MRVANPQPKRPNVSIINELRNESNIGDTHGLQEGKSFAWGLEKPLSDFGEHVEVRHPFTEVAEKHADSWNIDNNRQGGPNSPALYGMNINFNNILNDLSSGDRSKMGAGSAPPTLENNSEDFINNSDYLGDFTSNSPARIMHIPLKSGMEESDIGMVSHNNHYSTGRSSADIIVGDSFSKEGVSLGERTFDNSVKTKSMALNSLLEGSDRLPIGGFDGRSGAGHRESKSNDNLDSAFHGSISSSLVRSNSAPMSSMDDVGNPWLQEHANGDNVDLDHNFSGNRDSVFSHAPGISSDVVLSMGIPLNGDAYPHKGAGYPHGTSSSPPNEYGGIDLDNLALPAAAPPGSVEALIMRGCAEILIEASSHSLKAVELANTLRARVLPNYLAQIRERWGGLLALLEQAVRVFRVRRIPKNDTVALLMPGDTESSPRSRQSSRDGLSDTEKDSFGRPHQACSSGSENEDGGRGGKEQASRCLHVGNVPAQLTEEQLCREFEKFGEVEGLKIVAHRSRRFAFVTFVTIEQAISAKQRLVKLAPWKSAISYAHKESIAPPQPPKNYVPGEKQASSYKAKNGVHGFVGTNGIGNIMQYKDANGFTNGTSRSNYDTMGGQAHLTGSPYADGRILLGPGQGVDASPPRMMVPSGHYQQGSMADMSGFGYDAFLAMDNPRSLSAHQQQLQLQQLHAQQFVNHNEHVRVGVESSLVGVNNEVDPILRRLCDSTFVPTRDWPTDSKDQVYCSAIVQQLQHFHGYTSISKLRSALKGRLMSSDNIKSVPLKALLAAYPQYFTVRGNQVSLTQR